MHAQRVSAPKPAPVGAPSAPSAVERFLAPGPEAEQLAKRAGSWDVVMTIRPTPDAAPIVTKGMIADRTMIGLYLQEVTKPAPGSNLPDFRRIEYLHYDSVVSAWQYVSMDTRFPAGIMPAKGFGKGNTSEITVYFEPIAFVGFGREVEGRYIRSRHVTTRESDDRDVSRQYWTPGGGTEWLAIQYEYTRKR